MNKSKNHIKILKLTLFLIITFNLTTSAQTSKFIFSIDGVNFLSIKENPNGFKYIHQNNLQTSMFFGCNSGIANIDDPSIFNSGESNTAYGFNTLSTNTTGFQNTAIGARAMLDNISGFSCVGIGYGALSHNTLGYDNIGIGKSALLSNLTGNSNIAIGGDAFNNTENATRSIAIGGTAGVNDIISIDNIYFGFGAGRGTTLATDGYERSENTMVGNFAGYFNKTSGNVFLGHQAGYVAKADNQLYITNTNTDSLNTLIYGQFDNKYLRINGELNIDGKYTMPTIAPTTGNVLRSNAGGNLYWYDLDVTWESASGDDVVYEDGDIGIGIGNPIYRLDVNDNVNNGYVARFHNSNTTSASKGIIIQAGLNTNPTSSSYYTLFLDGNGTNIGGIRGNGAGGTMYSTTSDRRLKQNIKPFKSGLELLKNINPTIYQMKTNPTQDEIGFIAQDLQKVLPIAVGGNPEDNVDESPMTVDYGRITPVLVASIKEQQELIKKLTERLDAQEQVINLLKAKIDTKNESKK